jgi:hypothetical protein
VPGQGCGLVWGPILLSALGKRHTPLLSGLCGILLFESLKIVFPRVQLFDMFRLRMFPQCRLRSKYPPIRTNDTGPILCGFRVLSLVLDPSVGYILVRLRIHSPAASQYLCAKGNAALTLTMGTSVGGASLDFNREKLTNLLKWLVSGVRGFAVTSGPTTGEAP